MKQIHVSITKTYTSMKARDVKNENQMKSSFFCEEKQVSYYITFFKTPENVFLVTFVILIEESFYLVERKGNYVRKKYNTFFSMNNKCHVYRYFTL